MPAAAAPLRARELAAPRPSAAEPCLGALGVGGSTQAIARARELQLLA